MWTVYDRLISAVKDEGVIKDFAVGPDWCCVLTEDGRMGLSHVRREQWRRFPFKTDFKPGMPLAEAAAALKSWNPPEAALGLACINASFNTPSSVSPDAVVYPGGRRSRGVFAQYCGQRTQGCRTLMVEPYYDRDEMTSVPGMYDIIRLETSYRDYRYNAWEELLPEADSLLLSGISLENKLAGLILGEAVRQGKPVYIWGPDVPLAPVLSQCGVGEVTGFIVDDAEKCFWTVKRAGSRDEILKLGHFVTEKY